MISQNQSLHPARYWRCLENGLIQCELCPRECKLKEGKRGFCFVRQRIGDQMVLTTYGRSSGFCIDPVEKKPLNHFYPGSSILSFGTAGCNLGCKFCQNWDISKSKEFDRLCDKASPRGIALAAKKYDCKSVAFTYNDPIIFLEYAKDAADECHQNGIQTVAVTAGYIQGEARKEFFDFIDAANVDLKAFTQKFYQSLTGADLQVVLDTLKYIRQETNVWLEITTLLIPGKNDDSNEIEAMSKWILNNLGPDVPLHFSAFHPAYKMTDLPATPLKTLVVARDIAMHCGLHYVYTGNVHHAEGDTTYCSNCKKAVIYRDWYTILQYHLTETGACRYCNTPIAGVFDKKRGTWGSNRLPIRIEN